MRIINEIKTNPSYMALILALFVFASCTEGAPNADVSSLMDKTKEAAVKSKDVMKSTANDMKKMSENAIDNATDLAAEAKDKMAKGAKTGMDKTKELAEKTENVIENTVSKTKEAAVKSSKAMATKTEATVEKVAKAMSTKNSTPSPSKTTAESAVKESVSKTTSNLSPAVENQPEIEMEGKIKNKNEKIEKPVEKAMSGVSHVAFDQLLKTHVSSTGAVDYAGFKSDASKLNAYIASLSDNPATDSWSRDEQLAYWINVYNAYTIKLILDNYPVKSIKDINGGKPWDKSWIKIGGKTYSLNNIENDLIRPTFNEPRIHFAVNCAAKSCPPLHNRAWTAENLESNLESSTSKFINNPNYNQINASEAKISSIFDWYGSDFGDVKTFLNKYSTTKLNDGAKIGYKEYNWDLNGK
jgi:hypothetical protein